MIDYKKDLFLKTKIIKKIIEVNFKKLLDKNVFR